jgi:hypothetical protein
VAGEALAKLRANHEFTLELLDLAFVFHHAGGRFANRRTRTGRILKLLNVAGNRSDVSDRSGSPAFG